VGGGRAIPARENLLNRDPRSFRTAQEERAVPPPSVRRFAFW
jgi:hypothetical protein